MQVQLNGSIGPVYRSQSLADKNEQLRQMTAHLFPENGQASSRSSRLDNSQVVVVNARQLPVLSVPDRDQLLQDLSAEINDQVNALFGNQG